MLGLYAAHVIYGAVVSNYAILAVFLGSFLIFAYVMMVNDYFDVDIDRKRQELLPQAKKRLIVGREISRQSAALLVLTSVILGLLIMRGLPAESLVAVAFIVILSTLYSVPPIRYKRFYPVSTLGEVTGAFFPFLIGYGAIRGVDQTGLMLNLIPGLATTYVRLKVEARSSELDRLTGKRTIAVVHGARIANLLARLAVVVIFLLVLTLFVYKLISYDTLLLLLVYLLLSLGFTPWIPRKLRLPLDLSWGLLLSTVIVLLLH